MLREDLGEFLDHVAYRCSQGVLLTYLQNGSHRSTVRGRHTASAFDRSIIRSGQITVPLGWAISTRQGTVLHAPRKGGRRQSAPRPSKMMRSASRNGLAGFSQHGSPSVALLLVCPSGARAGRPLKALVSRDCHFDCRHTRAAPRAIQMTAGQNVKNARRPGPIGFGFGSGHSPTAAKTMKRVVLN